MSMTDSLKLLAGLYLLALVATCSGHPLHAGETRLFLAPRNTQTNLTEEVTWIP